MDSRTRLEDGAPGSRTTVGLSRALNKLSLNNRSSVCSASMTAIASATGLIAAQGTSRSTPAGMLRPSATADL